MRDILQRRRGLHARRAGPRSIFRARSVALLSLCAGTLAAIVYGVASTASSGAAPASSSVLTIAGSSPVSAVNPYKATNQVNTALYHTVFNALVKFNQAGTIVPDLASSW